MIGERLIYIVLVSVLLGGCVSAEFTKTGAYSSQARPPDCEFTIFTAVPQYEYKEIGYVEFIGGNASRKTAINLASEHVCANGGNAILLGSEIDDGAFGGATVLYVELEKNR